MGEYARGTDVPVDRSKAELEKLLRKYGATKMLSGWDDTKVVIGFEMNGRQVRLDVPIPSKNDPSIRATPSGKYLRADANLAQAWQGAVRQRWRALVLVIKAKLEAVASGISTFESEFLGKLVLPNAGGRTVEELIVPHLDDLPLALAAGPKAPTYDATVVDADGG